MRSKITPIAPDLLHMKLHKVKIDADETYGSWLKTLITVLLSTGIVKNDLFNVILPLCQRKVNF